MAHRTQITLRDDQYDRLREEAERSGASLSELVRRAVDEKYTRNLSVDEKLQLLESTSGLWSDEQADEVSEWRRLTRDERRQRLGL